MKVIANASAFYNGSRIRAGAEVEVPDGFKASWATPAESIKAAKPAKAKPEPRALSQQGKEEAKTFTQVTADKSDLA